MSIRLREINGVWIAVCAARSVPKEGDVYLDDAHHHALYVKFDLDFASEGRVLPIYTGSEEELLMEQEESNNPNRVEWDEYFHK